MVETFDFVLFVAVKARILFDMTKLQFFLDDPDTRKKVTEVLKVHRSAVHRWQKGKRFPTHDHARALMKFFPGLRFEELYISDPKKNQGIIT